MNMKGGGAGVVEAAGKKEVLIGREGRGSRRGVGRECSENEGRKSRGGRGGGKEGGENVEE